MSGNSKSGALLPLFGICATDVLDIYKIKKCE
jgi:hypothetical protein